jgi:hypothetical protein
MGHPGDNMRMLRFMQRMNAMGNGVDYQGPFDTGMSGAFGQQLGMAAMMGADTAYIQQMYMQGGGWTPMYGGGVGPNWGYNTDAGDWTRMMRFYNGQSPGGMYYGF